MSRPISSETTFRAIADPMRRPILELLLAHELTPSELMNSFHSTRQTLTFHLRVLTNAGLVSQQRRGRQRLYRAHIRGLRAPSDWLAKVLGRAETP